MDAHRAAQALALNRVLFGANLVLRPAASGRAWVGPVARRGGATVFARALGIRDAALGLGALVALRRGREPLPWMLAALAADSTDVIATWRARDSLPLPALTFALTVAGVSTAIAGWYVAVASSEGARPGEAAAP